MWSTILLGTGLVFMQPVWADSKHYLSETGEHFSISQAEDGKSWGTLVISDQYTASFAHNELILLQLDDQAAFSLEHGSLSCGSPAKAQQTVFYDFTQATNGLLAKVGTQPLPTGFQQIRQRDVFTSIVADRRAETVDFGLNDETITLQQLRSAKTLYVWFVTDDKERHQATFQLQ